MFDLRKIPMLRVLVPFCGGIVTGFHLNPVFPFRIIFFQALFLWIIAIGIFFWQRDKPGSLPWFLTPILFLLLFILGTETGLYTRPVDPDLPVSQEVLIRGKLMDQPQERNFAYVFNLKLLLLSSSDTICRTYTNLICYFPVPADSLLPAPGEIWQFSGRLVPISGSRNPGAPDYRSIIGRKDIWYRFYISSDSAAINFRRKVTMGGRRLDPVLIRQKVSNHWPAEGEEAALLKAVCLGDRSTLTGDMRQAYTAAGGMHLLAVSGLHVGLIWWVLQYITGWMTLVFRDGRQQTLLIVGLLWFYAFVTGFSSSVCRSVTMFSFFSMSRIMGERLQALNVVLVSAFLLILIEPHRLMDVGFQLSYAAIIGIISLHPLALRLVRVKNRVLRWIWEASLVSLAAQLATAPLVIYYFHQLPVYSIATNLIAVPLLSLLIAIFVFSIPFVSAGILANVSSVLLVALARFMNLSMEWLSSFPGAVLEDLQLNSISLLLWILLLLVAIIALHSNRRFSWYLLPFLLTALLLGSSITCLKRRSSSELLIAHFRGASMLSIREGLSVDHYCWYRDSTSLDYMRTYRELYWNRRIYEIHTMEELDPMRMDGGVSSCFKLAEGAWLLGGKHFSGLVLRAPVNRSAWEAGICPDFILLSGEPGLEGLKKDSCLQQSLLVIDGSNRSWYKERYLAEWDQVYLTDRSGAYVKRW